jgi:putative OPT family oligopeptide transporter
MPYDPEKAAAPLAATPPVQPYIPADVVLPELTWRALIMGTVLGMVFGASSLYLVLKVGLTVSASIPVAVIAITLFGLAKRAGAREATILETSITQTAGSAGESLAFGLGVTMPAILILGFDLEIARVMLVAVLGGLLGILMMIPMRRTLIVDQHRELKYPEGTACAEVLKAAATESSRAAAGDLRPPGSDAEGEARRRAFVIFGGFGIGLLYKVANVSFKLWKDTVNFVFGAPLAAGSVGAEISPELLGVGYIIGPRLSLLMAGGGVLSYLLLIPMIKFFGDGLAQPLAPGTMLIRDMAPDDIRSAYVLYIGAGAVAAGGLVSLARSLPSIWNGLAGGLRGFRGAAHRAAGSASGFVPRTEQDIPMKWVLSGCLAIITAITVATPLHMNLLGALLILVFGFLFSTVSSRLTGEVGSSSNPISGMVVATLLFTCLIFLLMGWTGNAYYVTALSVGAIVCIASSNAGATSQDLKTGYLVGATPRLQQYAILVGALASALLLGPILLGLDRAATTYVPAAQVAPGVRVDAAALAHLTATGRIEGPQAASDPATYRVWQKRDDAGGPAGKYLVRADGTPAWLVDPGINGRFPQRPDGTKVQKYDAPKVVLVSYIIKGILGRELPWALVMFGVMIALVLELCGVPSLTFSVGAYLPLASTLPIAVGGVVRWLADRRNARLPQYAGLDADALQAAGDRSTGTLLASGYIAGGALAGIVIAITAGVLTDFDKKVGDWASAANPLFAGPASDWLSLLPYAVLMVLLYRVAREKAEARATPAADGR